MTNIITKVLDSQTLWSITDGFMDILGEITISSKTKRSVKIRATVFDGRKILGVFTGLLSTDMILLYVPMLDAVWFYPVIYDYKGKGYGYFSIKNHIGLDISMLSDIADAQKYSALVKFKYIKNFITLKLENVSGSIDMNVFDNMVSHPFMVETLKIVRTKILTFLEEIPQHKLILYCTITGLIGVILGGIGLLFLMQYTVGK